MSTYRPAVSRNLAYLMVTIFMFTGAGLCFGIAFVLGATLGEGESLLEAIFWPVIGVIGFVWGIVASDANPTPISREQKE